MTDASLQALAAAGCGENLTSLTLCCECLFLLASLFSSCGPVFLLCWAWLPLVGVTSSLSPFSCTRSPSLSADKRIGRNAALEEGVTDASLQTLVQAGCGENLTLLDLSCQCLFLMSLCFSLSLFFLSVLGFALSSWHCLLVVPLSCNVPSPLRVSRFPSLLTRGWNEMQAWDRA